MIAVICIKPNKANILNAMSSHGNTPVDWFRRHFLKEQKKRMFTVTVVSFCHKYMSNQCENVVNWIRTAREFKREQGHSFFLLDSFKDSLSG
jgi:hypothetical protein